MLHCPTCGQNIDNNDAYCTLCGSPVLSITLKPLPKEPIAQVDTKELAPQDEQVSYMPFPQMPESAPAPAAAMPDEKTIWYPKPPEETSAYMPLEPLLKEKPKKTFTFVNTGLGLVITAMLLLAAVCTGFFVPGFTQIQNLLDLMRHFGVFALAAIAAAVSTRAKGPDLSIGAIIGTASVVAALFLSYDVALLDAIGYTLAIFGAFGLVNGLLTVRLKIPAVILTFVTGLIARAIVLLLTNGQMLFVSQYLPQAFDDTLLLIFVSAALLYAFALVASSRLGISSFKRKSNQPGAFGVLAYMASALFAAMAGILVLIRLRFGSVAMGPSDEFYVVFIYAALTSSRALDNRFAPVVFCLIPAAFWTLLTSLLPVFNFNTYAQTLIGIGLSLAMLVIAYACRREKCEMRVKLMDNASADASADSPALEARILQ